MRKIWPLAAAFLLALLAEPARAANPFVFSAMKAGQMMLGPMVPAQYNLSPIKKGQSARYQFRVLNASPYPALFVLSTVSTAAGRATNSPDFSVETPWRNTIVASGGSAVITVVFSPGVIGTIVGYLTLGYQVSNGSCSFAAASATSQCEGALVTITKLSGTSTIK